MPDDPDGWAAPPLDFIPVELLGPGMVVRAESLRQETTVEPAPQAPMPPVIAGAEESWTERTSLFGEQEA